MHILNALKVISVFMVLTQTSEATELRAYRYSYDHGDTAKSAMHDDQHIICDNCPAINSLQKAGKEISLMPIPEDRPPLEEWTSSHTKQSPTSNDRLTHRVHFKFDSSRISAAEANRLALFLKDTNSNDKVSVTGYTCDVGARYYNLKLSERRAKAVRNRMVKLGYKNIYVDWKGVLRTTKDGRAANRRSDVVIKVN